MMKEALDRQDYHREKAKQDGELKMWGRVKTIRMWGETAMGYQSRIEVSRTDPDEFTREAEAWGRKKQV